MFVGRQAASGPSLMRLNDADGSLDPAFATTLITYIVGGFGLQPDGKLLAAGQFQNGQQPATLLRVITGLMPGSFRVPGTSNLWLAGAATVSRAPAGRLTARGAAHGPAPRFNLGEAGNFFKAGDDNVTRAIGNQAGGQ